MTVTEEIMKIVEAADRALNAQEIYDLGVGKFESKEILFSALNLMCRPPNAKLVREVTDERYFYKRNPALKPTAALDIDAVHRIADIPTLGKATPAARKSQTADKVTARAADPMEEKIKAVEDRVRAVVNKDPGQRHETITAASAVDGNTAGAAPPPDSTKPLPGLPEPKISLGLYDAVPYEHRSKYSEMIEELTIQRNLIDVAIVALVDLEKLS